MCGPYYSQSKCEKLLLAASLLWLMLTLTEATRLQGDEPPPVHANERQHRYNRRHDRFYDRYHSLKQGRYGYTSDDEDDFSGSGSGSGFYLPPWEENPPYSAEKAEDDDIYIPVQATEKSPSTFSAAHSPLLGATTVTNALLSLLIATLSYVLVRVNG